MSNGAETVFGFTIKIVPDIFISKRFSYKLVSRNMENPNGFVNESEKQVVEETNGEEFNLDVENSDIQGQDEASRLRALAADVRDQDDLERDIGRQVRWLLYSV